MQLPSFSINRFLGLNDQPNAFALKPGECGTFDNWITVSGSAEKRPGYTKRISAAYAGTPKVTGLGGFVDSSNTKHFLAVMGGKLLEDVSGTWTERASGRTIDTTALSQIVSAGSQPSGSAHSGNVVINDQTNPPLIWSGSGIASLLIGDITRASCVAAHKEFLFLGDYTSTREGRSICTVAATMPDNPQTLSTVKSPTNRKSQVLAMIPTSNYVLIFLSDEVWWAVYAPSSGGFAGGVAFNFNFNVLDPGVGIVGPNAVCNVPGRMTVFWGTGNNKNGGPYIIQEKDPSSGPIYVGKRIETFISGIDSNYLSGIVAGYLPNFNSVIFHVPYGSSQATNNYSIVWNVQDDTWAIWYNGSSAFAFASATTVTDTDGSRNLYCGDYGGLVMKMGQGLQDNGQGYRAEMWTGWIGGPEFEKDWMELLLRMDLGYRKIIQVRARYFGSSYEDIEDEAGGAAGAAIGSFVIGVSAISGQSFGAMVGDLLGDPSTHVQFAIIDEQDNVPCKVHGLTAKYLRGTSWAQSAV